MIKKESKYQIFHQNTRKQTKIINDKNFTYRLILEVINKYLKSPKKILDIGCGAGTLSFYLASKGHNVTGIDISEKAINSCKESAKVLGLEDKTHFEVMNFPEKLPKGKYDLIIFSEVIEHLENDEKALKNIYTLLNQNGILFLSTPSKNAPLHRLGLTKKFDEKVGHLRRYDTEELKEKLEKNSFRIIETRKVEGVLRNFLFLNPIAGQSIRFIKFFISDFVIILDKISLKLIGSSNIIIIAKKILHIDN